MSSPKASKTVINNWRMYCMAQWHYRDWCKDKKVRESVKRPSTTVTDLVLAITGCFLHVANISCILHLFVLWVRVVRCKLFGMKNTSKPGQTFIQYSRTTWEVWCGLTRPRNFTHNLWLWHNIMFECCFSSAGTGYLVNFGGIMNSF